MTKLSLDALPLPASLKDIPPIYWVAAVLAAILVRTKNFMVRAVILTIFSGYGLVRLYTWFDAKFIVR